MVGARLFLKRAIPPRSTTAAAHRHRTSMTMTMIIMVFLVEGFIGFSFAAKYIIRDQEGLFGKWLSKENVAGERGRGMQKDSSWSLWGWVLRLITQIMLGCAAAPPKLRLITQIMLGCAAAPPKLRLSTQIMLGCAAAPPKLRLITQIMLGCAAAPPKLRLITQIMLGCAAAPPNLRLP